MSLIWVSLLALYVAWNLGANDVANSMGTSVGSKAVTLRQALIIAGVLEFTGAILFGQRVSQTLVGGVVDLARFESAPQTLMLGMISALLACGIWLQAATAWGLPVASSHAIVGAIAGFGWIAVGKNAVNWQSLGTISLTWVCTPLLSGTIAACFYSLIRRWILNQANPMRQLDEWIPWLSTALVSIFGVIVLPPLTRTLAIDGLLPAAFQKRPGFAHWQLPSHDVALAIGATAILILTLTSWRQSPNSSLSADFTSLSLLERQMARFQLVSACCVAFAHGSNDVGNAVAPLAAIVHVQQTGSVPTAGFVIPVWVLVLGGAGIVLGLAVWGKNVIATIGEGIIPLQPSSGFCAELATAATVLLASRFGLPVSTSHALVGAVVGIGLLQNTQAATQAQPIQLQMVQKIALAWLVTIPLAGLLSAGVFMVIRSLWN